jgi:pimeloyl-ACP methyl ester carboxylesterase
MAPGADLIAKTIHSGDQRIHFKLAEADGPLVLLCHGFPESWHSWRHQIPVLQNAGYRVAALDMRGFGRSGKPSDPTKYRLTELVKDCVAVIDALGESAAIIVGHDIGAPVAWTAAWTRPEKFLAVVGLSVPFSGSGINAMPGSPFGELHPYVARDLMTGPDRVFYSDYFAQAGGAAALEAELDLRNWLADAIYSLSADGPIAPEFEGVDLMNLSVEQARAFLRSAMTLPRSGDITNMLSAAGDRELGWLAEEDLDFLVTEFEYSGLVTPMNIYKNFALNWEGLSQFNDRTIDIPSLFMGGDRDINAIWGQEAIRRAAEKLTDLRGNIIIPHCGHWVQQEQPQAVNKALLEFLASL